MGIYAYRAVDQNGQINKGRLPAISSRELEARLQAAGLELLRARQIRHNALFSPKPPKRELINFCLHMETTLQAGLMVTEALEDLVESVDNKAFRDVLMVILQAVREGTSFSESMQAFPHVFDPVFVGMIRAGEESGRLGDAFKKLGENLRWQDELASQMKRMIAYPAFTVSVLIAVTVFMLVYLVPELTGFIQSVNGDELPIQTLILMKMSEFLRAYWMQILAAPFVLGIALFVALRISGAVAGRWLDAMKLRFPVVGPVLKKIILSRFSALLGMLYESGLPVIKAMTTARDAVGNRAVAAAINQAILEIEQGKGLSDAFGATGLFPNLMLRMIRIGETTGEVESGLKNVCYFYNRDIEETINKIQAMVEPVLTLALGVILASLMMSVLGPIYDLISKVGV